MAHAIVGDGITEADWTGVKGQFESSPIAAVSTWKSPVLLIHGDDESNRQIHQTRGSSKAAGREGSQSRGTRPADAITIRCCGGIGSRPSRHCGVQLASRRIEKHKERISRELRDYANGTQKELFCAHSRNRRNSRLIFFFLCFSILLNQFELSNAVTEPLPVRRSSDRGRRRQDDSSTLDPFSSSRPSKIHGLMKLDGSIVVAVNQKTGDSRWTPRQSAMIRTRPLTPVSNPLRYAIADDGVCHQRRIDCGQLSCTP